MCHIYCINMEHQGLAGKDLLLKDFLEQEKKNRTKMHISMAVSK